MTKIILLVNPENAKPYIDYLRTLIKDRGITSIVDVGCGDWQIMQQISLNGIQYQGFDVVDVVIERNRKGESVFQYQAGAWLKDVILISNKLGAK